MKFSILDYRKQHMHVKPLFEFIFKDLAVLTEKPFRFNLNYNHLNNIISKLYFFKFTVSFNLTSNFLNLSLEKFEPFIEKLKFLNLNLNY